jgi:hypothetical protein
MRVAEPQIPKAAAIGEYGFRVLSAEAMEGGGFEARMEYLTGGDAYAVARARAGQDEEARIPALDMSHVSAKWAYKRR